MADGGAPVPVVMIPRAQLDPDPLQPRRSSPGEVFDVVDIVGSIRSLGVTVPLLVEPSPEAAGRWRILDGERRYIATGPEHVPLAELPCIVRDELHPVERIAIQLATYANCPLPPLQEARAYARLLDAMTPPGGFPATPSGVGERLGRTARHVRQRLALLSLTLDAQALLGEAGVSLGVALEIAGLSAEGQTAVVTRARAILIAMPDRAPLRRADLAQTIEDQRRSLKSALWPLDDRTYPGGACTNCPKRTKAQAELFAEPAEGDACTDRICFETKAHTYNARLDAARAQEERAQKKRALPVVQEPEEEEPAPPARERGQPLPAAKPKGNAAAGVVRERRAEEIARDRALIAVASAANKRKADASLWRLLAGLVVRTVDAMGYVLDGARERRGFASAGDLADRAAMLRDIGSASEAELRALCVELLSAADETGDEDDSFIVACRWASVDYPALLADEVKRLEAPATTKPTPCTAPGAAGDVSEGRTPEPAKEEPSSACPLTWPAVERLAKILKFVPHSGAQSPANVWGCVERIRAMPEAEATRAAIYAARPSAGTGAVDIAILYLVEAGELLRVSGRGSKEILRRCSPEQSTNEAMRPIEPASAPGPHDWVDLAAGTVRLERDHCAAAESLPCPKCARRTAKGAEREDRRYGSAAVT